MTSAAVNLFTTDLRSTMGNSFVIRGLRDEAAHEQRDVDIRQTRVGERPYENEIEETKTQKSAESHKLSVLSVCNVNVPWAYVLG